MINKESYKDRVNCVFLCYERSKTYAEFCRRVFGKNLRQVSMMDMVQLEKLISVLDLSKGRKVLDVGCGLGVISEYISDITRAHVTGIDFAGKVIKRAQIRTKKKKDRLAFKVADIRKLPFSKASFDTIIAIDSLYFVKNLEKPVKKMKSMLTRNGQMGIFYTQAVKSERSRGFLKPQDTKLARVLKKLQLKFRTWDFTKREIKHWEKRKRIALKLMPAFRSEGNLKMGKELVIESNHVLRIVEARRISRYLYHVQV